MDAVEKLKSRAQAFQTLLEMHAKRDSDAELLLRFLTPLFKDIADGKVTPPKYYEYGLALGKDSPFYEPGSLFSVAEAQFIAALEDWESQPWYQEGVIIRRSKE